MNFRSGLQYIAIITSLSVPCFAQLSATDRAAVDSAIRKIWSELGSASASIAIVRDGKLAYTQTYGNAHLDPNTSARADMRYKIASNSKQITASAILLLAEDGKLSIHDPVSRFLPGLTRAHEVTIRELLSHTSGYQDYYPLDYVAPFMTKPDTPQHILDTWARKPLDFDPGTQWQYSNTNYVIAGQIIEKVTGHPAFEFIRGRILEPLAMRSAIDVDSQPWSAQDATGYTRYALGPARPAPAEAPGWMYAAGELAMTASDLSKWDISLMNGTILKPESLKALTTEILLKDGVSTGYALGLVIAQRNGHRKWAHSGGANGFISENFTLPDDKMAVTVLTNQDNDAAQQIATAIERVLRPAATDPNAATALDHARKVFDDLRAGKLDRSLLDSDANAYFTQQVVSDYATSLKALGTIKSFTQTAMGPRGGMVYRSFSIRTEKSPLRLSTFETPNGKLSQYLIYPEPAQK